MINPIKAGMALGTLFGVWHLGWSLLVAFGWAQPLIDFVFWMHFIRPVYVIQPFSLPIAAVLIVVTTVIGFVIASLSACSGISCITIRDLSKLAVLFTAVQCTSLT